MNSSTREQGLTVEYQDVVPSTDLPPYIRGKPQCYLCVTVGKLSWRGSARSLYKLPLPTQTYIRLKWWGDSSIGTFFRPEIEKYARLVRNRAQFCVRSKPQQIANYFKDMGSATFDILPSPNSLPIGRVLVPAVVSLSFNCTVRGSFPIKTTSANIIGQLQVSMTFKAKKCDCEDLDFEAVGKEKSLYCKPLPRKTCIMSNQQFYCPLENRISRYNKSGNFGSPYDSSNKESACYPKLSATGKYGSRKCACNKLYNCSCGYADQIKNAAYCPQIPPFDRIEYNTECPLMNPPDQPWGCRRDEMMDSSQVEVLNGLIESSKKLNQELVRTLRQERRENKDFVPNFSGNTGYRMESINLARVTVRSLQLNCEAIIDDVMSDDECLYDSRRKCPADSFDLRRIFIIEYQFPCHLTSSLSDETTQIVSNPTNQEVGSIRLDHKATFDIEVSPSTLPSWQTESINFLVLRKEFSCDEMSIVGTGSLPLRPVINSVGSTYFGCVPVRSVDCQFSEPPTCASLQVLIDLISCDRKDPPCFTPAMNSNVCPMSSLKPFENEVECKYQKCTKKKSSPLRNLVANFCVATENSSRCCSEDECPYLKWEFLYLFIYLEKAKSIPAARLQCGNAGPKCFKPNVYLLCRVFPSDECSTTATVWNTHDPCFCYTEMIPVKIGSGMLKRFKKDSIVIEVWTKVPSPSKADDRLLGLVKISMAVFYQALNNPDTARTAFESDCPLVAADGYSPIIDIFSNQERGKLKLAVALGTQNQINKFRQCRESNDVNESIVCKTEEVAVCDVKEEESICEEITRIPISKPEPQDSALYSKDYLKHAIKFKIENVDGFDSSTEQVAKCCYLQYQFLGYTSADETPDKDEFSCLDYSLQAFSTPTTPCCGTLQWNFTNKHPLILPVDASLTKFLRKSFSKVPCAECEIQFKLFASASCRKKNSKLLAKGSLPISKLCSAFSVSDMEKSQTVFTIPLQPTKQCVKSAGKLKLTVCYKKSCIKKSKLKDYDDVQIKFEVTRAVGLRGAAHLPQDKRLQDGINSYATIQTSFLPTPTTYESELVKNTFSPEYNFVLQDQYPVHFTDDKKKIISLAEILAGGFIEVQVFQKLPDDSECVILHGQVKIPTKFLLYKLSGYSGWYPLSNPSPQSQTSIYAGEVHISMGFSCKEALMLTLQGAREAQWVPPPHLSSLIRIDPTDNLIPVDTLHVKEDIVTFRLSVANAWIPKKLIMSPEEALKDDVADQRSYIYMRYKFHDQDTMITKPCSTSSKCKRQKKDYCTVKLVHQKTFLCQPNKFIVWYLREEKFNMQFFFTRSRTGKSKKKRVEEDKLLGSIEIDMSSLLSGGAQHVSGIYTLINLDSSDADAASAQVSLSMIPGNDIKSYEEQMSDFNVSSSEDEEDDEKARKKKEAKNTFKAIVSVERALYLTFIPSVPLFKNDDLPGANYYVTFPVADSKSFHKTKVAFRNSCPVWNDANEVQLHRKIFDDDGGKITFRIWQSDVMESGSQDHMVGLAMVDISLLKNGFPAVSGWYNVLNAFGKCQGEIKLAITPTEPRQIFDEKSSYFVPAKGIFNSIPLLCPVESPLGGVYCPSLASPISVNLKDVTSLRHLAPGAFDAEHNAKMRAELLKQIKELEHIRCNLHEKFLENNRIRSLEGSRITGSSPESSTSSSTVGSEGGEATTALSLPKTPQNGAVMPSGCSEETGPEGRSETVLMRRRSTSVYGKESGANRPFVVSQSMVEVNKVRVRNHRRSVRSLTYVSRSSSFASQSRDQVKLDGAAAIDSRDQNNKNANDSSSVMSHNLPVIDTQDRTESKSHDVPAIELHDDPVIKSNDLSVTEPRDHVKFDAIPTVDQLRSLNAPSDADADLMLDVEGLLIPTPTDSSYSLRPYPSVDNDSDSASFNAL